MQYICIIFCVCIAVFSSFKEKNVYNPLTLFFSIFGLTIFLANMRLYGLYETSQFTYTVIFIGLISTFFGYILIELMKTKKKISSEKTLTHTDKLNSIKKYKIRYNVVYVFCFIAILFLSYSAFLSIEALLQGYTLDDIRGDIIDYSNSYIIINKYIIKPFTLVIIPLSVIDFFIGRKTLIKLSLIIIVLTSISNGGRFIFYYLLVHFIIMALFFRKKVKVSKKIKKRIILTLSISIVLIITITNLRTISASLLEHIYFYLAGAIKHLDLRIDLIDSTDYTYGINFFRGYFSPIMFLLHQMGITEYPHFYTHAVDLADVSESISIAENNTFNAFVTPFFYFYLDGGFFGVIIGSVINGSLLAIAYHFVKTNPNILNMAIYLLVIQSIVTLMVRWQFIRPEYALTFICVFFLLKKRDAKNRIVRT